MLRVLTGIFIAAMLFTTDAFTAVENDGPIDFSLPQLHGGKLSVADFRGKWVVLNYWATWCAPCRKEIPELSALHEAREDVVVLGLAFEDTEIENFDEFMKDFHPSYPLLQVDVYAPPEPFGAPRVLPTSIVIDPQGYPLKTFLGPVTRKDIESYIDAQAKPAD